MTLFVTTQLCAQLTVTPIAHKLKSTKPLANARATADIKVDTIALPFWDDFSFSSQTPSSDFWFESDNVFINAGMGINPPTINVATFDGSTSLGFPYSSSTSIAQTTDVLTSQAINLAGNTIIGDKIVLSFYWQMQGNGYLPEEEDKFSLELLNQDSVWTEVWDVSGIEDNLNTDFQNVTIPLENEYLHGGFQFRFQSFGNTGGAFDMWHLDYVYLNRDRPNSNESIDDHAIASAPSSIFKSYSMMPRSQLAFFPDSIFNDISFALSSFEDAIHNVSYTYSLLNLGEVIDGVQQVDTLYKLPITNGVPLVKNNPRKTYTIPALQRSDLNLPDGPLNLISEVTFLSDDEYFILSDDGTNTTFLQDVTYNYRLNDTSRFAFDIDEILAYDDGTAELSAGINKKNGRIAVAYELATPDTLTHVDIYFPNVGDLPDNPRFKLYITKDLDDSDSSIYTVQEFSRKDTSRINGFTSYKFVNPSIISGKFYIIFEQFSDQYFPIGLDANSNNGDKIHVKLTDQWEPNNILDTDGSLMVRARFAPFEFVLGSAKTLKSAISTYPNPIRNFLNIDGQFERYQIINLSGKIVYQGTEKTIATNQILNGLYLLKVFTQNEISNHKIVIQH